MDREQFVNGDEIVDYWGYLKSVSDLFFFHVLYIFMSDSQLIYLLWFC